MLRPLKALINFAR